ncbi:MAG TPA: carboxypeptidase regulatory-like domain-containing protein, partial [Burkholderiales bacterium]|nr:carboxypeptidase regulatory-like domain-containing protein [Burkholderiales bacterium]
MNGRRWAHLRRLALCWLCAFGLLHGATARAQGLAPEVSRGLAWLQGQVQADGSLANEASSVATALQDRSETAQALATLAALPSNLADAIASESDGNTEYLARQAIALIAAGRDASAQINLLLLRRNGDRGFGGGPGFESNALDTAWVVLALTRAGQGTGTPAQDARAYLMTSLQSDGGVAAANDALRIEYSAAALLALQTAGDGSTATTVRALASWLLQRQGVDGSWQGDIYLTAFSVIAAAPTVTDQTARAAASSFLLARQGTVGSWQDDPFLTAVALRALITGSASPAAAVLTGKVIDQGTNLALAGVSVSLSGTSSGNATTGGDGRFTVSNLTAGTYSAQLTRTGYSGASVSYTVFAGQTLDAGTIALSQIATAAIVRGRVTAATGGAALAGVSISVIGGSTLAATTDASGGFEFSGVPPSTFTITASLTGYQSVTGNATIAGGQTLVFSPALYKITETTPTTGHFTGRTVVAGSNVPLAGVTIVLNGAAAGTSGSDGRFDLTLNPQSYIAAYNLTGYDGVSQSFVLSAGTIVDAGTVALPAQRTTTSITGVVTASNGSPLGGAALQVLGGASVTTGTDGAYALTGLTGGSFDLRASATGYQSQLISLQVPRPSDVVQNFALFAGSGSFAIGDPNVSPASVGANANVTVSTSITNTGSSSAAVVLRLQVIDLNGANGTVGSVIGTGAAFDSGGTPIGQVQLNANESRAVRFVWNSGRFAAGNYQLLMRLVAPGSITQATPQGSVLLERPAAASVVSQTHFTGSIIANPPVLRAGTNTAVKLSAAIQNDGNAQLPPQGYTLNVIDTQNNAVAHTQSVAGRILAVSELDTLPFDDWTPAAGGNFRIELTSPNPAQGKITASLYVGDAGSAQYTTNKLVVPAGTQTVRANITIT